MSKNLNNKLISLIVPCFNEELSISKFYYAVKNLEKEMPNQKFQVIFVDDGSTDKTLANIKKYQAKDSLINYISFSRNFGKESAILAGLKEAEGDYCVIVDADLQHPLWLIKKMYERISQYGCDLCSAKRTKRKNKGIGSFCSSMFYKITNAITDIKLEQNTTDFCMFTKDVRDAILDLPEKTRFTKGIYEWIGFKKDTLEYEDKEREEGVSSWTFGKLVKYAIDGLLIFSSKPIYLITILGFVLGIFAFGILLYSLLSYIFAGAILTNAILIGVMCLMTGVVNVSIGIVGLYILYIYKEVQGRPSYIIKEKE